MRETWLPPLLAACMTSPCLAQGGADAASGPVQPPAAVAATPTALTLAQAIGLALERHPELAAARSEVQALEAAQLVAGARPAAVVEGELEDIRRETRSTTLLLAQPIELGGKRQARLDAAERGRRPDELRAISGAHTLLTNVLAWNTHRMNDVVLALRGSGMGIEDDWLRRIGPAHFGHINFRDTMRFGIERYEHSLLQNAAEVVGRSKAR